jgi:6-phospho-3-hexuloisomerase
LASGTAMTGTVSPVDAWLTAQRELTGVFRHLDEDELLAFARQLTSASGRLFFTGQGRSGLAAQMAAMRFMHLGRVAHFVGEATAPSIRQGDTLVVVSGSGQTPVSVEFARTAKQEGARVLLVTHQSHSPLAQIADQCVTLQTEASAQFGGTLFEQSALVLLDSIVGYIAATTDGAFALMWYNHANLQ